MGRPREQRLLVVRPPEVQRRDGLVQRKDVGLEKQLLREIDKGLRNSRVGIVLVTPALLKSIETKASQRRNSPCCSQAAG